MQNPPASPPDTAPPEASERLAALVIGAGPAGLMAAEMLGAAGYPAVIAEAKPSAARKLLMAGKSGLNLTKDEPAAAFLSQFGSGGAPLAAALAAFGPDQVKAWAEGLGQPVFTGSTGRVFPRVMKASPLLRAWLGRLEAQGSALRRSWRWLGWEGEAALFATPEGPRRITAEVTILALGGASWARLGSDGAWAAILRAEGQELAPFQPANVGLLVDWSAHMQSLLGQPLKNIGFAIGGQIHRGECVISAKGLEGGGIYPLVPLLRAGQDLALDLAPDVSTAALAQKLASRPGQSVGNRLRRAGLPPVAVALAQEFGRPLPSEPMALAARLKNLPVRHSGLRPMDEAISTAGGLRFAGLSPDFELLARPNVFAAGEMLDWEAPTGGYLLTGCFASGRHAGLAAAARLSSRRGQG